MRRLLLLTVDTSSEEYQAMSLRGKAIPRYAIYPALRSLVQIGDWRAVVRAIGKEKEVPGVSF